MPLYDTIIFDLDGTLLNPGDGIIKAVRFTLRHYGREETDDAKLHAFIGPPLIDCFAHYFPDDTTQQEAVSICRKKYSEEGLHEYQSYPNIEELLQRLKDAGKTLAVATNKITPFAQTALTAHQLTAYFDHIVGNELDNSRHNKTKVIQHVLKQFAGVDLKKCVMVGDTKYDILAAHEVGMDSIGVVYGYGTREDIEAAKPTSIAHSVEELSELLL